MRPLSVAGAGAAAAGRWCYPLVLPLLPPAVGAVDFDPLPVRTLEQLREMFVNVTGNVLGQEYFHVEPK